MRPFADWCKEFTVGKTEISSAESSDYFSVHSRRRFLEGTSKIWELAITYTGRLVVRFGEIDSDGITINVASVGHSA